MKDLIHVCPGWLISVDTGGTFTDAIGRSSTGEEKRVKVLSSGILRVTLLRIDGRRLWIEPTAIAAPHLFAGAAVKDGSRARGEIRDDNLAEGWIDLADVPEMRMEAPPGSSWMIVTGEEAPLLAARLLTETPLGEALPVKELRVGTTRGTNALLENKGAKVGVIVTEGFRDLFSIRDQRRPDLFARVAQRSSGLDPLVWEVSGRIDAEGQVIQPLDRGCLRTIIREAMDEGCEAMAVSLLNAYQNSEHEEAVVAQLIEAGFSYVVGSADLRPFIHYLYRSETAVVDATLGPVLESYLGNIEKDLGGASLKVMTSGGSILPRRRFRAMESLLSGPAGGVAGAAAEARRIGLAQAITFDMGGTSTDVARWAGDFDFQNEQSVGRAKILSRSVRIETVAAGGGSLCRVENGQLRVGPESAGSIPGPAAYGAGGPLALTDVNLLLDRLDPDGLSIPLSREAAEAAARHELSKMPSGTRLKDLLLGWIAVANLRMAQAIREISVGQGYDPAAHALIAFGGAGGMHACGVAEVLGMRAVVVPRHAGLLSAVGIAETLPEVRIERQLIEPLEALLPHLAKLKESIEAEGRDVLRTEGVEMEDVEVIEQSLDLRLLGQESTLTVDWLDSDSGIREAFKRRFVTIFGYLPASIGIEVVAARVRLGKVPASIESETFSERAPNTLHRGQKALYHREVLAAGDRIVGPALVTDAFSTTYIAAGWIGRVGSLGTLRLDRTEMDREEVVAETKLVKNELLRHRCYGIAAEMGEQLRRTGLSANIRERLDFSCAMLDAEGQLVVNAPHIPVHLGALGECVRAIAKVLPLRPGDVVITNHPGFGGSHLPDITLISGVFEGGELVAILANRAHHAELGGMRPGSMPAEAGCLVEEGVVIAPMYLCIDGEARWEVIETLLKSAPYPSRAPKENLADLHAQLAALKLGEAELLKLIRLHGVVGIRDFLAGEVALGASSMRRILKALPDFVRVAEDRFDDGTPLSVSVEKAGECLVIDFSGSSAVHPGNLNATPAIVRSALLYVLRLLVDEPLPLNEGLLASVKVILPEGILNPSFDADAERLPAVVGGNVETSQRLVDLLLEVFRIAANGPGTMNNVLFGNERFGYYETIGGGAGASEGHPGGSGLHVHMTNTAITDAEVLEKRFPVRLWSFSLRSGSGGKGRWAGGEGLERIYEWLEPLSVSLLTQRRRAGPRGLEGGESGARGSQANQAPGSTDWTNLPGITSWDAQAGEKLRIQTPGGGAWGNQLEDCRESVDIGGKVRATYHTTDAAGMTLICPDPKGLEGVIDSLGDADEADFPDVSLIHVSGWTVTIDNRWIAVLERLRSDAVPLKVLPLAGKDEALQLWLQLARGDVAGVLENWAWELPEPG